jgi:quercetin dioxygenase-like cupin family protein
MKKLAFLGALVALATFAFALDEQPKDPAAGHVMIAPGDLKWTEGPAGLPSGAKIAAISGDRTKEGLFTIRLQFPAGFKVPPHTHPVAEHVTVISGTLNLGSGPKFDEAATHEMTAGSFAAMPAGMQHFATTKTGCVLQVHAMGPFEIKYVNPADDPRQAKK